MTMYVVALMVGGALLLFSLLSGGHSELGELHQADAGSGAPLASLSFWTFATTFGGLTGVALSLAGWLGPLAVGLLSASVGFVAGYGFGHLLRRLRRDEVSSGVEARDYLGALGQVVLPIASDAPGKVRLSLKGRLVDVIAHGDGEPIPLHAQVLVHQSRDDGSVSVVSAEERRSPERASSPSTREGESS